MRVPTPHYRYMLGLALIAIGFVGWQVASAQETQTIVSKEAANPPAAALDGSASNRAAVDPAGDPQQTPNPTAYKPKRCDISQPQTCLHDFLHDQAGIWTSPLRLQPRDTLWLLPLAAATAVSLHYDSATLVQVGTSPNRIRISNDVSNAGMYGAISVAGATYIVGKFTHNETARETGVLSLEAVADASLATEVLKLATNRQRPNYGVGNGPFWADDTDIYTTNGSFPSGHATISWAVAHVMADETKGHPWWHLGFYAAAAAVSVTRVTSRNHFPSDALVGSAIGYLVGGYVYRQHSGSYAGLPSGFLITPTYDAPTRSYGMAVTFDPATLQNGWAHQIWSKTHAPAGRTFELSDDN
ncbi:MAG TPA: phosphatase PAP2 family protein [Candidatus Acidoferrales bacterium]|nr:phosphatase PAP2 family protein [Candidatus Acidoferrales bacterium]